MSKITDARLDERIAAARHDAETQLSVRYKREAEEDLSAFTELRALRSKGEAYAWEGYWPGAGSIDSITSHTRSRATMERWIAEGAEITPLYTHPAPQEAVGVKALRDALRDIAEATDADNPDSYRADDREGCLDTVYSIATKALTHPAPATVVPLVDEMTDAEFNRDNSDENPNVGDPATMVSDATHRHVKRGTEYVLIGIGKMQAGNWHDMSANPHDFQSVDMREVAVYRSAIDPTEIWVRPREEFEDGRFAALVAALTEEGA